MYAMLERMTSSLSPPPRKNHQRGPAKIWVSDLAEAFGEAVLVHDISYLRMVNITVNIAVDLESR